MLIDPIEPARILIVLMKSVGMWTFNDKHWNQFYIIYGWTVHSFFTFLFILAMYINIGLANNLEDFADALYMSLTETALLIKVINILSKIQQVVDFLQIIDLYVDGHPKTDLEKKLIRDCQRGYCQLRNAHIGGSLIVLSLAFLSSVLDETYRLPFPCWMPFEYQNDKHFYYAYTYVVSGMIVTAVSNFTIDLFQSFLLFQISVYYELLAVRLQNIGFDASIDFDDQFNEVLRFHSFIERITKKCEQIISFPVMFQMMLSAFVLCFTGYQLRNISFRTDPGSFLMFVTFAIVMGLQVYIPCNYGNKVTYNAHALSNAIYNCNWINIPTQSQKTIFIYMEYLKRPVEIRAGKFFIISLGVFTKTINNAYSLFALLLNIEK